MGNDVTDSHPRKFGVHSNPRVRESPNTTAIVAVARVHFNLIIDCVVSTTSARAGAPGEGSGSQLPDHRLLIGGNNVASTRSYAVPLSQSRYLDSAHSIFG